MRCKLLVRINLIGTALVFIAFGFWGLLDPVGMVKNLGLEISVPSGATAIRSIYGGFLIGLGLFLIYCVRQEQHRRMGLLAILFIVTTILLARTIGALIDGGEMGIQLVYGAIEAFSILLTTSLLFTLKRET